MKKVIEFIAWVKLKDLALAKIIFPSGRVEYAVVKGVSFEFQVWDYSLGYYDTYEEAEAKFLERMRED